MIENTYKHQCEELAKQLAFSQGQFSVVAFEMQALKSENSDLRKEISMINKEKESFDEEKKKSYKLGFSAGQKSKPQKKTSEKVLKEDKSNVTSENEVKPKEEVKFVRNRRWAEIESDDSDESDSEVPHKVFSKTQKLDKASQKLLKDGLSIKARNVSSDYDLFEKEFLSFLEKNTKDNKFHDKMIMNFREGENIFRMAEFVPFYTPKALAEYNAKKGLKSHLKESDFVERFNSQSEKYVVTLCGLPYQTQITMKDSLRI